MSAKRPLSPHLTIYRPQLTTVLSILHRGSGVFLTVGLVLLVLWFYALAADANQYNALQAWWGSSVGRVLLFFWSAALFYHLVNGIRHLVWDMGFGFELKSLYLSGWLVVVLTTVVTLLVWWLGYQWRA